MPAADLLRAAVPVRHLPRAMRLLRKSGDLPKRSLWDRIKDVALTDVAVIARGGVSVGSLERLEETLLEADFGVPTTLKLVADVERLAQRGQVKSQDEFLGALRDGVESALRAGNSDPSLASAASGPTIVLVIGVNGAGKTTLIGKLAARYRSEGKRVLVGAGDTFRAGAVDQLKVWAQRAGAEFVGGKPNADPASVAFDAVDAAVTRAVDVAIVDTAGRLHTSDDLMTELKKVARVIAKRLPGAPHETLLVLDGTIGQNAIAQARFFSAAVPVTGIVVTKLDGTARGGVVVAVHEAIDAPVKFVGVGEAIDDLEPFDAATFAHELLSD
jgi:fused signal recognition particle receptor